MSDTFDDLLHRIPANDRDALHHEILAVLTTHEALHKFKAAVLFSEAVTEMKTAIARGEFHDNEEAAHALIIGCEVLANEASVHLTRDR